MSENIYYNNIEGLSRVGVLDENDLSYAYNTLLVLKHDPTGRLFYAQDSGCSCPTPFEDYRFSGPDDNNLTEIKVGDSYASFEWEVESFPDTYENRSNLLIAVREALKNQ